LDRVFLEYYEEELTHVRALAAEFADMHPAVARNLSLDVVPSADPYVERLLEGVAYLAARTRLKLDGDGARFARTVLDTLYPDLLGPTPATSLVAFQPGPQLMTTTGGHLVKRGARLVAGLRQGLATRATYTTAQDVTLWPLEVTGVSYWQDLSALSAAGIVPPGGLEVEAGLRVAFGRVGPGSLAELALDRLDLHFADRSRAPALFDALHGFTALVGARPEGRDRRLVPLGAPKMIGITDDEALMPRTRPSFEGYRLMREYFVLPERFHFVRVDGLLPVVRRCEAGLEVVFLLRRAVPELAGVTPRDLALFVTPVINLFERDCNVIEIDPRRTRQVVHADRTRPRDFEIYRLTAVEDAETEGAEAVIPPLYGLSQGRTGWMHSTERRPRRPGEDERRQGQMRTSYGGDDVFLSLSRPAGATGAAPRRLAIRALCTNRDLALLDDSPTLALESGDPVAGIRLLGGLRPPRAAIPAVLPRSAAGDDRADEIAWRLVAQLSLNFLSLAEEGKGADPLHAMLDLYADRGDPALARHARAVTRIEARPVVERLAIAGPMCFGRGSEITLHVDQAVLAGHSGLLLTALLARLFARHATVNSFVRTCTRLTRRQEDVRWPMTPGERFLI
jgi:type VI secretion system protein ImpG